MQESPLKLIQPLNRRQSGNGLGSDGVDNLVKPLLLSAATILTILFIANMLIVAVVIAPIVNDPRNGAALVVLLSGDGGDGRVIVNLLVEIEMGGVFLIVSAQGCTTCVARIVYACLARLVFYDDWGDGTYRLREDSQRTESF